MINVEIDEHSGFCFGVTTAIRKAEEELQRGAPLYCLGDIVHNGMECERLRHMGLTAINHDECAKLRDVRVLLRAHGEPPETYAMAKANNIEIIDATCPVVAKLQERVVKAHAKMREVDGQVVILGKRGHAEVIGLAGQVADPTIIVENKEELEQIDFSRPIFFLSQTTQSVDLFEQLRNEMLSRLASPEMLTAHDTICRQVSSREKHLEEFARKHDVIIFVCGRKSSNGKVLAEVCRAANPRTYNIEEAGELQPEWIEGAESIGICGATSTPKWLMQEVADQLESSK